MIAIKKIRNFYSVTNNSYTVSGPDREKLLKIMDLLEKQPASREVTAREKILDLIKKHGSVTSNDVNEFFFGHERKWTSQFSSLLLQLYSSGVLKRKKENGLYHYYT